MPQVQHPGVRKFSHLFICVCIYLFASSIDLRFFCQGSALLVGATVAGSATIGGALASQKISQKVLGVASGCVC